MTASNCCNVRSCFFIPLWSRRKFCFWKRVPCLAKIWHHLLDHAPCDPSPVRSTRMSSLDPRPSRYISVRIGQTYPAHSLRSLDVSFVIFGLLPAFNWYESLTKLFLVEIVCEKDGGQPLNMFVTWWLSSNVFEVGRDGRIVFVKRYAVAFLPWFWLGRKQGLSAICSTAIDVDTMSFLHRKSELRFQC